MLTFKFTAIIILEYNVKIILSSKIIEENNKGEIFYQITFLLLPICKAKGEESML